MSDTFDYTKKYLKVINDDDIHFGHHYTHGYNKDPNHVTSTLENSHYGFHFTNREHISKFQKYGNRVCEVTIPPESPVVKAKYHYNNNDIDVWKSFELNLDLESAIPFELFDWNKEDLRQTPELLQYIHPQTPELVLTALTSYQIPDLLYKYIQPECKTKEVLEFIVNQNGSMLHEIEPQYHTDKLYFLAVQNNPFAIICVPSSKKTKELCFMAVTKNGMVLKYIEFDCHSSELYLQAVQNEPLALQFVPFSQKTKELCLAAVTKNGMALQFIEPELQTKTIKQRAISQNPQATKYLYTLSPSENTFDLHSHEMTMIVLVGAFLFITGIQIGIGIKLRK